jgi:hypothetical protein
MGKGEYLSRYPLSSGVWDVYFDASTHIYTGIRASGFKRVTAQSLSQLIVMMNQG